MQDELKIKIANLRVEFGTVEWFDTSQAAVLPNFTRAVQGWGKSALKLRLGSSAPVRGCSAPYTVVLEVKFRKLFTGS